MIAMERPTTIARLSAGPVEYRLERHGDDSVLVLHGGHVRAGLALGEEVFTDLGYSALVRPVPIMAARRWPAVRRSKASRMSFANCGNLGIGRLAAVLGISAGGRTAATMAVRHPKLVERLILESAFSFLPWPALSGVS